MSVCIHHTSSPVISQEEKQLLKEIADANRYPVCRFELRSRAMSKRIISPTMTATCSTCSSSWWQKAASGKAICLTMPL